MTYSVSVTIDASAASVWALVSDAPGYKAWNSTVDRIEGDFAAGAKVLLYAKTMPDRPFRLKVMTFEAPRRMVLQGGMPFGLFVGTRRLEVLPQGSGRSRFVMEEGWTGALSPIMSRLIPDQQPTFEAFASDLKRRAERG